MEFSAPPERWHVEPQFRIIASVGRRDAACRGRRIKEACDGHQSGRLGDRRGKRRGRHDHTQRRLRRRHVLRRASDGNGRTLPCRRRSALRRGGNRRRLFGRSLRPRGMLRTASVVAGPPRGEAPKATPAPAEHATFRPPRGRSAQRGGQLTGAENPRQGRFVRENALRYRGFSGRLPEMNQTEVPDK